MKIHQLTQGSPEWLAYRAQHFNASDAPAMMGCSPYKTRAELLRELHTGLAAEVDAATQRRFDDGHRFEALARPLAEAIISEDLYPVTGSAGRLSASFDGLTMDESIAFEHKSANADLRAIMQGEDCGPRLPLHYRAQMEQQLLVSGAERVLFMATLWDGDTCTFSAHCWYEPDAELRADILRGWAQFERDLFAYVPPAAADAQPVGKAPDTLPALHIEVQGMVTASNLAEFKQTALTAIRAVKRDLRTDADFADADKAVKWCADVEARLKAAKEHALSQTASIDALFKALDDIAAESKAVRLDLAKLVTRRKDEVREQAVSAARAELDRHVADLNGELAPMRLQPLAVDLAGAIKGLRSIASMQDALDNAVAAGKIAADAQSLQMRRNLAAFSARAAELGALFPDLHLLVHKAPDDFAAVLDARISKHQADEAEKARKAADAEAQRIAAAEQRARDAEAARIAEQQREDAAAADAARKALEAANEPAPAALAQPTAAPILCDKIEADRNARAFVARVEAAADEPATLKLGVICERLGFTVSAAFLGDVLHVRAARTDGRAVLFRESQWPVICQQLRSHVGAMAELYSTVPA